jgi:hypothetical protein
MINGPPPKFNGTRDNLAAMSITCSSRPQDRADLGFLCAAPLPRLAAGHDEHDLGRQRTSAPWVGTNLIKLGFEPRRARCLPLAATAWALGTY